MQKYLKQHVNLLIAIVISLSLVGVGYALSRSQAATAYAAAEAEQSTLDGLATAANSADASDGKYLRFGDQAPTPPPPPPVPPTPPTPPTPPPTPPSSKILPTSGVLLGSWIDIDGKWVSNTSAKAEVTSREQAMGRKLAINQHFYSWANTFPGDLEQWDRTNGRLSLVTWEPHGITLDQIINGSQDSIIKARAKNFKTFGNKIFLRWGHEMNGNWYDWDGYNNGQANGPAKYIAAYKHIFNTFKAEGVTNVTWVWCVNSENIPNTTWNQWDKYYPDDEYVDWVGIDAYNWGGTNWRSLAQAISPVYNLYASRKPIMLPEFGSVEAGGNKGQWLTTVANTFRQDFPQVRAMLYFDAPQFRLDSSTGSWNGWRTLYSKSEFGTTIAP